MGPHFSTQGPVHFQVIFFKKSSGIISLELLQSLLAERPTNVACASTHAANQASFGSTEPLDFIILGVAVLRAVYDPPWNRMQQATLILISGFLGSCLMSLIGVRGPEVGWLWGYGIGGFLAGGTCAVLTIYSKRPRNEAK